MPGWNGSEVDCPSRDASGVWLDTVIVLSLESMVAPLPAIRLSRIASPTRGAPPARQASSNAPSLRMAFPAGPIADLRTKPETRITAASVRYRVRNGPAVQSNGFHVIDSSPEQAANPFGGSRHDNPAAAVRHVIARPRETYMCRRPEFRAWRAEEALVQRQRFGILPAIDLFGIWPAGGGVVMQRRLQLFAAPDRPVVARIDQVLVPDLVDDLARRDRRRRDDGEETEAAVGI